MITKELRMAATEVNQILRYLEESEVNKIPVEFRLYLREIEDPKYISNITPERSLFDQNLLEDTRSILGMIYCYYWSSEEELAAMPEKVKQDAKAASKELFEEYSPEQIFEGARQRRISSLENQAIVEMRKIPWYKKLFGWFRKR